jgi:hypothetical protein
LCCVATRYWTWGLPLALLSIVSGLTTHLAVLRWINYRKGRKEQTEGKGRWRRIKTWTRVQRRWYVCLV